MDPALKSLLEKARHSQARSLLFQDNRSLAGLPHEGCQAQWIGRTTTPPVASCSQILLPELCSKYLSSGSQLPALCPQEGAPNIPLPASCCSQPSHTTPSPNSEANYGSETSTVPWCTIPIRFCLKPINHHYKFSISEQVSMGQHGQLGTRCQWRCQSLGWPLCGENIADPTLSPWGDNSS